MSEMFGDDSKHMLKQDVMKESFGWTVPVESVPLPSRGLLYDPDTTLFNRETVPIKAMTAHEEDILSSQAFIKEGQVIDRLIESCVADNSFGVSDLTLGDRNALMIAIRITGYGTDYRVKSNCQNCDHSNTVTHDLSDLPIRRLAIKPVKDGTNAFEYTLPVTKKNVVFKFLTVDDEKDRNRANKNEMSLLNTKIEKNVTSYLRYAIISVDGITDKNKINHFVTHMPAYDSKSLRGYIQSNEPGMDMQVSYVCDNCGHRNESNLPMTSEFFWPST